MPRRRKSTCTRPATQRFANVDAEKVRALCCAATRNRCAAHAMRSPGVRARTLAFDTYRTPSGATAGCMRRARRAHRNICFSGALSVFETCAYDTAQVHRPAPATVGELRGRIGRRRVPVRRRAHVLTQKKSVIRFRAAALLRVRTIKAIATTHCTGDAFNRTTRRLEQDHCPPSNKRVAWQPSMMDRGGLEPRRVRSDLVDAAPSARHPHLDACVARIVRLTGSGEGNAESVPTPLCVGGGSRGIPAALFVLGRTPD